MSTRLPAALLAAGVTCVAAAPVRADTPAQARAAIQKVLDGWNAAAARKDIAGMFAHHTPDHVSFGSDGTKEPLADVRAQFVRILPTIRKAEGKTVIRSLTLKGDTATVVTDSVGTVVFAADPKTKGETTFRTVSSERTLWVKRNGAWLEKESRELSSTSTADGKPVH
jgi:ketosteroid isomerase-like protein